ncbi:MAG: hypothetical protein ACP59X_10375 [Solidesulfovibrio sp. DCME]|uniref:hypothetical protein n=1 Tax=Solidesulfovibrio sp. DCME TaxID=3447380 RepID=UPI003D0D3B7C
MDESFYHQQIVSSLANDFIIHEQVEGVFPIDNIKVIIDFIIYPKNHLIENGFEPIYIGVEVKSPSSKDPESKFIDAVWQAHTYSLSSFGGKHLAFVLLYPPIEDFINLELVKENIFQSTNVEKQTFRVTVERIAQRANVGFLKIENSFWKIFFSGRCSYYTSKYGKNKIKNIGSVRYVGNTKRLFDVENHRWCK